MLNITGKELDADTTISFLEKNQRYLTDSHLKRIQALVARVPKEETNSTTVSDLSLTDLDLLDELRNQLAVVRALRENLVSSDITEPNSAKNIQGLISTSNTLFNSITKLRAQVMKQESQRRLENATITAIKSLNKDEQDLFFETLKTELERAGA